MNKNKFLIKNIPGWAVMLAIFGVLYLTGLHTEAIGQVQRLLLATGIKNADVPETLQNPDANAVIDAAAVANTEMAGAGFQMVDLDGKQVSFESLKGKVVFMNIWATWCPPCIAEMPNIQKLYDKVGSEKIAFVMLSVDEGGMEKVKKFIKKKGYTFPVYMPASQLPQEFYSNAIPTTFIISPAGKIVAKQEGMADYNTKEVRDFLTNMVK
ncbi:TlpA family protein disulfide reductase [Pontibacter cellulosilyticus]|uniref:TlpA family protein disulfide reductase n=1 Tax=Pontibacter cellulosilyticus TaxID=1720253 RepID=A0A923NBI2_9BACT|nr:TlpA family protein disulfide reductase [Pontibacter cellulosilyticus]MBC5994382.1 TlpA family protein disulfide reductase [Pontibacter cellulosilyticus]